MIALMIVPSHQKIQIELEEELTGIINGKRCTEKFSKEHYTLWIIPFTNSHGIKKISFLNIIFFRTVNQHVILKI